MLGGAIGGPTYLRVEHNSWITPSVRDGHDIVAATIANGIAQILRRFSPIVLSRVCSTEIGPSDRPRFLKSILGPTSPPDVAYLSVVRPSVKEFREVIVFRERCKGDQGSWPDRHAHEGEQSAERTTGNKARENRWNDALGASPSSRKGGVLDRRYKLLHGDTERAKLHLLESVRTNGSVYMRMIGPNLSLASELLKRNEREVVIDYL